MPDKAIYWCFHCGNEADSPSGIVHADDCRSQTNIRHGKEKRAQRWCDKCGETWCWGELSDCPYCHRKLKMTYC